MGMKRDQANHLIPLGLKEGHSSCLALSTPRPQHWCPSSDSPSLLHRALLNGHFASQGPLGVGDTFTGKTRLPGAWRGVGRGRGDGTLAEGTVNHDEKNLLMKSVMVAKEKNR